ncbi:capsule biosynthesis protein, partial [Shimia sp.]|uniref:capsule biosynthesis protein n=1 Tax=Shimia sp. TaxID=1954381 RepID=UPI003563CB5F
MDSTSSNNRVFLFLQGPHGPFFHVLGKMLRRSGATVWRVGFNAGDAAFWPDRASFIAYRDCPDHWPAHFDRICEEKSVTDIVLYGDVRPAHAGAIRRAKAAGLRVHVFEEGYLRPFWVTYERDGSNGHSRLMQMSIADMEQALAGTDIDTPLPPAHWGDMRQHVFYGALYHWFVMFRNGRFPHFRPHRALPVTREFQLYLKRLLLMPALALERKMATLRIKYGGFPYHLTLLQLEHDSSFQEHSPFSSMTEFLELVIAEFARGAPPHHHLVFKAHPLEDGRAPLRQTLNRLAAEHGLGERVHFVRGGKLAQLLNEARSAVTVNSTAAQQVLWRGIPLRIFGRAVY